jgi:hypothetical protein
MISGNSENISLLNTKIGTPLTDNDNNNYSLWDYITKTFNGEIE